MKEEDYLKFERLQKKFKKHTPLDYSKSKQLFSELLKCFNAEAAILLQNSYEDDFQHVSDKLSDIKGVDAQRRIFNCLERKFEKFRKDEVVKLLIVNEYEINDDNYNEINKLGIKAFLASFIKIDETDKMILFIATTEGVKNAKENDEEPLIYYKALDKKRMKWVSRFFVYFLRLRKYVELGHSNKLKNLLDDKKFSGYLKPTLDYYCDKNKGLDNIDVERNRLRGSFSTQEYY